MSQKGTCSYPKIGCSPITSDHKIAQTNPFLPGVDRVLLGNNWDIYPDKAGLSASSPKADLNSAPDDAQAQAQTRKTRLRSSQRKPCYGSEPSAVSCLLSWQWRCYLVLIDAVHFKAVKGHRD